MEKQNNNEEKKNSKMPILDWVMAVAAVIGLVICYFFWGCKLDPIVSILCLVVVLAGTTMLMIQNKKLKEANEQ